MAKLANSWNERIERLIEVVGAVEVSRVPNTDSASPLVAVTSSRLGHDTRLHRHICRFLCRSMIDCRSRGGTLMVASGSAIEPWAVRAAELFAVPLIRVTAAGRKTDNSSGRSNELIVRASAATTLSRDQVLIALADRVDAVYVRRGGMIERCLRDRVLRGHPVSTRVAVSGQPKCAAAGLIADGAIGWFWAGVDESETAQGETRVSRTDTDDLWTRSDGQWLVHCTRGRNGAWPGETERQYRDSILLGDESSTSRGPLDALSRIIRSGRIVAASTATKQDHPVVCFSALPLSELLQRRCFRPQLGRWDYEPYGIAIRTSAAKRIGIQPVVYGEPSERATLAPADQYRFHPIGKTFDWRSEREWRSRESVGLDKLDRDDIRIFAADTAQARSRLKHCPWRVTFVMTGPTEDQATKQTADQGTEKAV